MLCAKDLMTKTTIVVPEEMLVTDLTKLLRENRIGGVPVISKDKKICGVVTVTDVFQAMRIVRRMQSRQTQWLSLFAVGKKTITVKEIYNRKIVSVQPETPIEKVADLMLENNAHTLPVMNEDQTVLHGVVGRHDITWAVFGDVAATMPAEKAS